jgi:hypothetical protein
MKIQKLYIYFLLVWRFWTSIRFWTYVVNCEFTCLQHLRFDININTSTSTCLPPNIVTIEVAMLNMSPHYITQWALDLEEENYLINTWNNLHTSEYLDDAHNSGWLILHAVRCVKYFICDLISLACLIFFQISLVWPYSWVESATLWGKGKGQKCYE